MSGFVGLFDRTGAGIERDQLESMLSSIDHRGPDGSDSWCDDRIGLGHQQLQSTPESRFDSQPYREDGLVVTGDSRIDNRDELFREFSFSDPPERVPDSRLLLAAYQKWGTACVDHLVGAFAFVIWDDDKKQVFCARDHFGVKPFYYYCDDELFAAASEIKAILGLTSVVTNTNKSKIGEFLIGNHDNKTNSFFKTLRRLPPAHAATISNTTVATREFWDLDPTKIIKLESDAAYERRFRELFEQAVNCRLRTNGPVGSALSGGLDSSSISVMANKLLSGDDTLHTFSNVYSDAPSTDEREFIETVTNREGIIPHYLETSGIGSLVDREHVFDYFDQPPHDTMHFALWTRVKEASNSNVAVLLEGALGDSAVGYGLGLLPQLFESGRWLQLYSELRAMHEIGGLPIRTLFFRNVFKPLLPERVKRSVRKVRGNPTLEANENPALDQAFVDQIGLRRRINTSSSEPVSGQRARRRQYRSLKSGMITASLETTDLIHAAFGTEPRYPFTDKRLVEFSLAMPATQQLADGWTRSIIRRSLTDILPDKIRTRPWKTTMEEGFWDALSQEDDELQNIIRNPELIEQYFEVAELKAAYNRFNASESTSFRDARILWRALSLSEWLENTKTRESTKEATQTLRDHQNK